MKFDSEIAEHLYGLSLESFYDGVTGDVAWTGHYTKFLQDPEDEVSPGAYILREDSDGFVTVNEYADNETLDAAWSELEREYEVWLADE